MNTSMTGSSLSVSQMRGPWSGSSPSAVENSEQVWITDTKCVFVNLDEWKCGIFLSRRRRNWDFNLFMSGDAQRPRVAWSSSRAWRLVGANNSTYSLWAHWLWGQCCSYLIERVSVSALWVISWPGITHFNSQADDSWVPQFRTLWGSWRPFKWRQSVLDWKLFFFVARWEICSQGWW